MKSAAISFLLLIIGIGIPIFLPTWLDFSQDFLSLKEIPSNSSQIAGVQKYNIPPLSSGAAAPLVSAKALLVKDLATGTILLQKDANLSLPIASTTKIMTALVAEKYFKQNDILTVSKNSLMSGSSVGLNLGESLSFRSLLYGMLLNSGNDAAYTIANNFPGGLSAFVGAMNQEVANLGLKNTHFDNPAGFDSKNHFSSAANMAIISEEALKRANLTRVFATKETNILSLDKKYDHRLVNLNKLLSSVSGVLGIKTGTTDLAKENLVTLVERNGHRVLFVLLGSNDRFAETTKLINWAYNNFTWVD
ncbi:MAG: D-alanyl-D-alanine carboxypeptidase [Candidatus Daviesbacteria bacterium]|nr:MAG: D-alanyl-D-alanine carboxypeptidase [Candidatus Daviesbacteria bacterium]